VGKRGRGKVPSEGGYLKIREWGGSPAVVSNSTEEKNAREKRGKKRSSIKGGFLDWGVR